MSAVNMFYAKTINVSKKLIGTSTAVTKISNKLAFEVSKGGKQFLHVLVLLMLLTLPTYVMSLHQYLNQCIIICCEF